MGPISADAIVPEMTKLLVSVQNQTITEKFSEACQQILEVACQKEKIAEELTVLKADHFDSSKSRKMK
jgi:Na+/phosphate symporter